ncbi:cyclase family protein [Pelagibius sp. Alg239-R121]|uniref:cyclase family protein n=1 Tax=Pelagibius sp. Alg239-R121 TaxID=2993448 RepID=UPI0024A74A07|nr:cyclase family protein [Pelagibius sp. Alg239-R121]
MLKKLAVSAVVSIWLSAGLSVTLALPADAQDWTTSPWGAEDEIGAVNLITPESVLAASKLIKTGKTYNLGIIVDSKTPAFAPRTLSLTILQPNQISTQGLGDNHMTYNDDIFMGWLGIGPQIDGLAHIGIDHVYYNGHKDSEIAKADGMTKLGLEKLPPIVARGVMLDMAAYYGVDMVEEGTPYTKDDIMGAAKKQGVEIRKGDVVLFHSGWLNLLDGENPDLKRYVSVEPGIGKSGAEYLVEIGVVAVGGDTWGLEAVPFPEGTGVFEIHQILIPKNGIFILENMDTRELAKDKASEFLFVLGPARLRGAVQMIINPIAIR